MVSNAAVLQRMDGRRVVHHALCRMGLMPRVPLISGYGHIDLAPMRHDIRATLPSPHIRLAVEGARTTFILTTLKSTHDWVFRRKPNQMVE